MRLSSLHHAIDRGSVLRIILLRVWRFQLGRGSQRRACRPCRRPPQSRFLLVRRVFIVAGRLRAAVLRRQQLLGSLQPNGLVDHDVLLVDMVRDIGNRGRRDGDANPSACVVHGVGTNSTRVLDAETAELDQEMKTNTADELAGGSAPKSLPLRLWDCDVGVGGLSASSLP